MVQDEESAASKSTHFEPLRLAAAQKATVECMVALPACSCVAASGNDGIIRFWNYRNGRLVYAIRARHPGTTMLKCLGTDVGNEHLVSGCFTGYLRVWKLLSKGLLSHENKVSPEDSVERKSTTFGPEESSSLLQAGSTYAQSSTLPRSAEPNRNHSVEEMASSMAPVFAHGGWKAHDEEITGLQVLELESHVFILSAARDCRVCLWHVNGSLIGVFGQGTPWNLLLRSSWATDVASPPQVQEWDVADDEKEDKGDESESGAVDINEATEASDVDRDVVRRHHGNDTGHEACHSNADASRLSEFEASGKESTTAGNTVKTGMKSLDTPQGMRRSECAKQSIERKVRTSLHATCWKLGAKPGIVDFCVVGSKRKN